MDSPSRKKLRMEEPPVLAVGLREHHKVDSCSFTSEGSSLEVGVVTNSEPRRWVEGETFSEPGQDNSQVSETESELLAEGEKLSGAALKEFLRHNFEDYLDQRLLRITDLEGVDH
ncbi:hypothetical protein TRVL_04095 [Trypanosoma vivax]|nr:hypothetical protein TRVL_04095 [Trypanosoma vivax]